MHYWKSWNLTILALLLPVTAWGLQADSVYSRTTPSRDGIGKIYMGREISQVMGHRGAAWLERASRVREEGPDRVVDSLTLQPDDVVADIGAGTGYFSFRIASRVPDGRVLATGGTDKMVRLWDMESGKFLRVFRAHPQTVTAVAISPDGRTLASGSNDHTVKLWDIDILGR